jgi:uncharacterized protein (DUF302 family)
MARVTNLAELNLSSNGPASRLYSVRYVESFKVQSPPARRLCGRLHCCGMIRVSVMEQTTYGLRVTVPLAYEAAMERAIDALKAQGFGVLTTIDVQQTLRAKLNRKFRKYVILGACNPPLADRALQAELDIGLLLPCNVIVYETKPLESVVAAIAPLAALGIVGENPDLISVATEADQRLRRALAALETSQKAG